MPLTSAFFFSDFSSRSFSWVSTRLLCRILQSHGLQLQEELGTHISLRMKSSRVSTLLFASAWSCCTRTGPMSL